MDGICQIHQGNGLAGLGLLFQIGYRGLLTVVHRIKHKVNDSDTAREYRLVAQKGKGANGREFLEAFDYMGDVFNRCERNFSLAGKWGELTAAVVENF